MTKETKIREVADVTEISNALLVGGLLGIIAGTPLVAVISIINPEITLEQKALMLGFSTGIGAVAMVIEAIRHRSNFPS